MKQTKPKPARDLPTLLKQMQALQKEIDAVRAIERAASLAEVLKAIETHDFTAFELGFVKTQTVKPRRIKASERTFPTKTPAAPRPPKYVNPETGATWSGHGMAPRWMVGPREDYLIPVADSRSARARDGDVGQAH
jgi:DNA-binding protein H-NS